MRSAVVVAAWAVGVALGAAAGAVPARAAEPGANVVAQEVRAIAADPDAKGTALLLVFVVDDAGDPLDSVTVSVLQAGKEVASGESDARGRTLLRLSVAGPVVVRAVESGLVPSEAHGVELRRAGLSAVVLPLEDASRKAGR